LLETSVMLFVLFLAVLPLAVYSGDIHRGFSLLNLETKKAEDLQLLQKWQKENCEFEEIHRALLPSGYYSSDVLVPPKLKGRFLIDLEEHDVKWTVLSNDVLRDIEKSEAKARFLSAGDRNIFNTFLSLEEIEKYLHGLKSKKICSKYINWAKTTTHLKIEA